MDKESKLLERLQQYEMFVEKLKEIKKTEAFTDDPVLLKVSTYNDVTIAHVQAEEGWATEDKEILMLADSTGWTVAHEQACHGWETNDPEILRLTDKQGISVQDIIATYKKYEGGIATEKDLGYWDVSQPREPWTFDEDEEERDYSFDMER